MATFVLLGKYSTDSVTQISPKRTKKAEELIKSQGGKVKDGYALLGEKDIMLIVDAKDVASAMKISVGLSKLLGIGFTTSPAVSVGEFDKLMKSV